MISHARIALAALMLMTGNTAALADNPAPKPQAPAKPPAAKAASAVWTTQDIAAYCLPIADGNPNSHAYQGCMERQQRHLGRVKTPADINDLENARALSQ
ncbi:MAG: hypothetical protein KGJ06_00095 [Pseudomonadota bacterium]|nr:hypothetical protein [Pseudomonadota bacterium]